MIIFLKIRPGDCDAMADRATINPLTKKKNPYNKLKSIQFSDWNVPSS